MLDGRTQLCVTNEIIDEYEEIIGRNVNSKFASLVVDVLLNNPFTLFVTPFYKFNIISSDPDDNKFVDCCVAANAAYLVTEDHHFDVLREIDFPPVRLIGIDDFMSSLPRS